VVINTADGQVTRQSLSHRCCEFPTIPASLNGKPAKFLYAPAAAVEDIFNWGPNQVRPPRNRLSPASLLSTPCDTTTSAVGPQSCPAAHLQTSSMISTSSLRPHASCFAAR